MKKSASKKTLIASAAAISLSALLFAGTTYAWFTDSASSATSTIQSGNLDVNLYKGEVVTVEETETAPATSTLTYTAVGKNTTVFDITDNWEPGVVSVQYLQVKNEGSLALDYKLTVDIANNKTGISVTNKEIDLTKILKAAVVTADTPFTSRADAIKAAEDANSVTLEELQAYTGKLVSGTNGSAQLAVIIYMPETVDNDANNNGEKVPSIDLGVTVEAKQSEVENDSYGNDYDADATYTGIAALKSGKVTTNDAANPILLGAAAEFQITEAESLYIDLNNQVLTGNSDSSSPCVIGGSNPTLNLTNGTFVTAALNENNGAGDFLINGTESDGISISADGVLFEKNADDSIGVLMTTVTTDGNITFTNCKFDSVGLQLSTESTAKNNGLDILFEDCEFTTTEGQKLVYLLNSGTITATFKNCYVKIGENTTKITEETYKTVIFALSDSGLSITLNFE